MTSNSVAVAYEHSEIARKVYNDHINYVLNNVDVEWNWPEVDRLAAIANDADRELEAARDRALNECSCTPNSDACPVCLADNRERYGDSIPFGMED